MEVNLKGGGFCRGKPDPVWKAATLSMTVGQCAERGVVRQFYPLDMALTQTQGVAVITTCSLWMSSRDTRWPRPLRERHSTHCCTTPFRTIPLLTGSLL